MKTFASLFTGGGLADIGALDAGYELLWGVELDADIAEVANQNLSHRDRVHAASVIDFDWSSVERPDHLHMSPPCQVFSVAKTTGKKANPNDDIADACIEAIKALQPSSVTLENVEGYRKAKGFQKIVDTLWGLGYWVNVDVLNSADFGVPQTRRRLILRAVHGGFPAPLPPQEKWRGWYEAIEDLIPELPETQFAEWQLKRLPVELRTAIYGPSIDPSSQDFTKPRDTDEPTFTVRASTSSINNYKAFVVNGTPSSNGKDMTHRDSEDPIFTIPASAGNKGIRAHLIPGGNASSFSVRDGEQPSRTVESTERVGNLPRALLVEARHTRAATVRDGAAPHVSVTTDDRPSHAPKALLLNSAFPQSNGKKHYTDDEASFTVDTTSLGRMKATAQGRVVRMTPRALARFQTVPDWYELPSKNQLACKIIGNGVPCLMMQRILEAVSHD